MHTVFQVFCLCNYPAVYRHLVPRDGSYHSVDGASIWVNGIPEKLNAGEFAHAGAVTDVDWGAAIGVRDTSTGQRFPMKGYVDDFKYYYKVLTSADKYIYFKHFSSMLMPVPGGLCLEVSVQRGFSLNPPVDRQMLLEALPSPAVDKNIGKELSRDKEHRDVCHSCTLLAQERVYSEQY